MADYILIILLALLAILGAPLFAVILAVAMLGFYFSGVNLSVVAIEQDDLGPCLGAHHVDQMVGLLGCQRQRLARSRYVHHVQALHGWVSPAIWYTRPTHSPSWSRAMGAGSVPPCDGMWASMA